MYIAFTSHTHIVLHLRIDIMKERDMKKCLSIIPINQSRPHLAKVIQSPNSLENICLPPQNSHEEIPAQQYFCSVQMCLAITAPPSHMGMCLFHTPSFLLQHTGVFKSLWPAFSCNVIMALIKGCTKITKGITQSHGNLGLVLGRRMSTAARLVQVCQFAWHNSYPGKLVLLLLLCTIFSVFSLPMIFFNLHSHSFFNFF